MSTSPEYIAFVCEQIRGAGDIRYRKMFGEYMVYVDEKPVLLVCDDTVFVKMLPELSAQMAGAETGCPYDGAKEHYLLDIENIPLCRGVIAVLKECIPVPQKRRKNT